MAILPKAQIITFTRAQSFDIINRSKHLADVVINVMCSSGWPGTDMAAGNFSAISCTLLSTLHQVHPPPPPKKMMWKLGFWHRCCIGVQGSGTVSSQASVPWSLRGSQCLNLQGPAVQEERLDSYIKGTTALCNIRDHAPNQTALHLQRLQCSCRWWLIKITCTNSGSCYWLLQLAKQYKWKRCGGVAPQQFTTTCRRLRNTTCGKQPLYHGMPEIISIHYIYKHLEMWNKWKNINKMIEWFCLYLNIVLRLFSCAVQNSALLFCSQGNWQKIAVLMPVPTDILH